MGEYVSDYKVHNSFSGDCFVAGDKDGCFATVMVSNGKDCIVSLQFG